MKAITFLGVEPKPATYAMQGREFEANQFGIALARFVPNLTMRALVTQRTLEEQYPAFARDVEDYVTDVRAVPINDGKNTEELWQLFESVVEQIDENEEVIFDITHSFRSLPFLSFLAAAYVRIVKRAQIRGVYYANYAAQYGDPAKVPVIDLTEFVQLLDWMTAADYFAKTGDSADLANLIQRGEPGKDAPVGEKQQWQATGMKATVELLAGLSMALRLLRPMQALTNSAKLGHALQRAAESPSAYPRPFAVVADQVAKAYFPIALEKPKENPAAALKQERELVEWYLARGQYVHAVATAREWLVTWTMLQAGRNATMNRAEREVVGRSITAQNHSRNKTKEVIADLSPVPELKKLADLYDQLGAVRNDLLHAGKNQSAQPARRLADAIRTHCSKLADFPLPTPEPPTP